MRGLGEAGLAALWERVKTYVKARYVPKTSDTENSVSVSSDDESARFMAHIVDGRGAALLMAANSTTAAGIIVTTADGGAIDMTAPSVAVSGDEVATQAWVGEQSFATKAELEAATGVDMSAYVTEDELAAKDYLPKSGGTLGGSLTFSGDARMRSANSIFRFGNSSTDGAVAVLAKANGNDFFRPGANNAMDLGTNTAKWRNLYLSGNLTDGTNSVAVSQMAKKSDLSAYQTAPVTLYDNASGTAGTVTLSETAANFSYIEIFAYCGSSKRSASVKVPAPNGKTATLFIPWGGDSANWEYRGGWAISGTTMTCSLNHTYNPGTSATASTAKNEMYVCKVVGYR